MEPSSKEMPQFNLPPPPSEQSPAVPTQGNERAKNPEKATAAPEKASAAPIAQPAASGPSVPVPKPASNNAQSDDNSTTKTTKQPLLEDSDLIEKEWVSKAKRIVENTRNDPHKQSEELTVVKADYMKQHYGKTIKLDK